MKRRRPILRARRRSRTLIDGLGGLSPMESLKAITRNAVRLMGLKAHVGTVESG